MLEKDKGDWLEHRKRISLSIALVEESVGERESRKAFFKEVIFMV